MAGTALDTEIPKLTDAVLLVIANMGWGLHEVLCSSARIQERALPCAERYLLPQYSC